MAYGELKDLARRAAFDKFLRYKTFNTARNPKYEGCQRGLASMVYKVFDKRSKSGGVNTYTNVKIKQNQLPLDLATHQLAEDCKNQLLETF